MPHDKQKNRDSDKSSDSSESCDDRRGVIICPPSMDSCDSGKSDCSHSDFSSICTDRSKSDCKCKESKSSDSCSSYRPKRKCRSRSRSRSRSRCKHRSRSCSPSFRSRTRSRSRSRSCSSSRSRSCSPPRRCKEQCCVCKDHSRDSILRSIDGSSDSSECPRFARLAYDAKDKKEDKKKCKNDDSSSEIPSPPSVIPMQKPNVDKVSLGILAAMDAMQPTGLAREQVAPVRSTPAPQTVQSADKPVQPAQPGQQTIPAAAPARNPTIARLMQSNRSASTKKFTVSFGSSDQHQWNHYNQSNTAIHVSGKIGPVLHMKTVSNYIFEVTQDGVSEDAPEAEHYFILTDRPEGGEGSTIIHGGPDPIASGTVNFKIDKDTPRYFYYQCSKHTHEGGLVMIHDS